MEKVETMEVKEKQRRNDMDKVWSEEDEDETKEGAYMHLLERTLHGDCNTRPTLRRTKGKTKTYIKKKAESFSQTSDQNRPHTNNTAGYPARSLFVLIPNHIFSFSSLIS